MLINQTLTRQIKCWRKSSWSLSLLNWSPLRLAINKSPTLCALSQMFKLPVIGTLCHAQSKGYGDRCVAKEICGEGFFWRPKNETGKRFFRCSFIRNGFFARLSCCCVSWPWASTLLEFLFRYPCWCYMNCHFDFARVAIRVTINKLYFVPE